MTGPEQGWPKVIVHCALHSSQSGIDNYMIYMFYAFIIEQSGLRKVGGEASCAAQFWRSSLGY